MPGFVDASLEDQATYIRLRERILRTQEQQAEAWCRTERERELAKMDLEQKRRELRLRKAWHAARMAAERKSDEMPWV